MTKRSPATSKSVLSSGNLDDALVVPENLTINSKPNSTMNGHWSLEVSTGKATFVPYAVPAISPKLEVISHSERRRRQGLKKRHLRRPEKAGQDNPSGKRKSMEQ